MSSLSVTKLTEAFNRNCQITEVKEAEDNDGQLVRKTTHEKTAQSQRDFQTSNLVQNSSRCQLSSIFNRLPCYSKICAFSGKIFSGLSSLFSKQVLELSQQTDERPLLQGVHALPSDILGTIVSYIDPVHRKSVLEILTSYRPTYASALNRANYDIKFNKEKIRPLFTSSTTQSGTLSEEYSSVTVVDLSGIPLNKQKLKLLVELFPNVQILNLSKTGITADTIQQLGGLAHVMNLDLSKNHLGQEGVEVMITFTHWTCLESLNLSDNNIGANGVRAIANSPHFSNLISLDLSKNNIGADGVKAMATSKNYQGLANINLADNDIGDKDVQFLMDSTNYPNLISLDLSMNPIGADGVKAISASKNYRSLQNLRLESTHIEQNIHLLADSTNYSNLTSLDLSYAWLTDEDIKAIANLKNYPSLIHLRLAYACHCSSGISKALSALKHFHHLMTLNLTHNYCHDEGARLIADATDFPNLTSLDLSHNFINDYGAAAIARSKNYRALKNLNLSENSIRRSGVEALAAMKYPSLTSLDLRENYYCGNYITAKDVKIIQEKLPQLLNLEPC